jgi:Fe-S-cluster containining protein
MLRERYRGMCERVDEEFARNREMHGDKIRCGPGCTDCCSQLFQITEVEAAEISRGVREMEPDARRRLTERAVPYMEARSKMVTAKGEPEAWGSLPPMGTRLPCPALEDGVCSIYEFRPLICRKFGIPLYNPAKPERVFACELNFTEGDEIVDYHLVEIQSAIHEDFKSINTDYSDNGGKMEDEPLTVARAILEDFSSRVE